MRSRKHATLLGAASLMPAVVLAADPEKVMLRRNRITAEIGIDTEGTELSIAKGNKLEDLWELEAAQAELDAIRLLGEVNSMSMTPRPTPTRRPTPTAPQTPPPTYDCLEGRSREDYFADILGRVTMRSLIDDPNTAQGLAYSFLVNDDPLLESPCGNEDIIEQRFGLATFYYATGGNEWTQNDNWMTGQPECEWLGITCGGSTEGGRSLQAENRVIKIELPFNNLVGFIPNEISTLYEMENINLFANSLQSTIPAGISNLTMLLVLDLERNLLTGSIMPDSLAGLDMLGGLRLSRNNFRGSIANFIGDMTNLQHFWIGLNDVTGTIPTEIGRLSLLQSFFVYGNRIRGSVPSQFGRLTDLTNVRMDTNQLSGVIPEELYRLTALSSLRLDANFLIGSVSPSIGRLTDLEDLRLSKNDLEHSIPQELESLTNLQNLILYDNFFNGTLPDVFQDYVRLEQFDVSKNFLQGTIPTSLFEIISLRLVYLSNNTLEGPLPANFQTPPLLRDLWVDGNQLTGTIPEVQAGRLQQFNEFLVNYNNFVGSMPQSICDLRQDAILDDVFSDCGGEDPQIDCTFEICCNRCFVGEQPPRQFRSRVRHL